MGKERDEWKKTIGFRPTEGVLDPEGVTFLRSAAEQGLRSEWISRACQMLYDYEHYKKGFLIRMMTNHFEFCKHALRKIGRRRNEL